MAFTFNPFTGNFDVTGSASGGQQGSGGPGFFQGEVATYADLPLDGTAPLDSRWLVRSNSGTWPFSSYKQAGIYIRTATGGTDRDADYDLTDTSFHDVMSDDAFLIFDNTDPTKAAKFDVGANVSAGQTRVISVPDKNITLDDAGDSRTPTSHASSHASAGSDPLFDQNLNTTDNAYFNNLETENNVIVGGDLTIGNALVVGSSGLSLQNSPTETTDLTTLATGVRSVSLPDASGTLALVGDAPASHTHGNITNGGLVGTTANLPLKTGTGGIVEAGVFGTGAGEFAEGNHTHADLHTRSHAITSTSDHTAGNHKVFYSNGSGEIVELALGNSGEVLTSNGASAAPSFAAASGGGVTTGSVDNAILRADGTGGSTSQSSDINIEDATTSTQNNVTISNQHSGQTNSALVLAPKGNGPLLGQKPNGAASGGNSRGNFSTDFQRERTINSRVASGNYSVICGGYNNSATNTYAFVGSGDGNQATAAQSAIVSGNGNTASAARGFIGAGLGCTASGDSSGILSGQYALADRAGIHAHANGRFGGVQGSAQRIHGIYSGTTTTNSAVTIVNLSVPASKVIAAIINIVGVKSDGSASAHFVRRYSVKNSGGTTSEVYAAETIGTDVAASTSVTLSASDANDQLVVECTGIVSETWRWVASVDAVEVSWAT